MDSTTCGFMRQSCLFRRRVTHLGLPTASRSSESLETSSPHASPCIIADPQSDDDMMMYWRSIAGRSVFIFTSVSHSSFERPISVQRRTEMIMLQDAIARFGVIDVM